MHEVQWWVVTLFVLMSFNQLTILFGRASRYLEERGNGKRSPVTAGKMREILGIPESGKVSFMEAAQETNKARFDSLVGSVNALTQINGRLLEQIKELVALEQARIELRQQGD